MIDKARVDELRELSNKGLKLNYEAQSELLDYIYLSDRKIERLEKENESLKKINDDYINRNQVRHSEGKDFDMYGYRLLENGEKVREGDEFLGANRRWYKANDVGHIVDTKLLRYRREIK